MMATSISELEEIFESLYIKSVTHPKGEIESDGSSLRVDGLDGIADASRSHI